MKRKDELAVEAFDFIKEYCEDNNGGCLANKCIFYSKEYDCIFTGRTIPACINLPKQSKYVPFETAAETLPFLDCKIKRKGNIEENDWSFYFSNQGIVLVEDAALYITTITYTFEKAFEKLEFIIDGERVPFGKEVKE